MRHGYAVLFAVLMVAALTSVVAFAAHTAVAVLTRGDLSITLMAEPCELPFLVQQEYRVVTWKQDGATYNGCWTVSALGIVLIWTEDKRLAGIPASFFSVAHGI